jgi:hypothetical protein
VPPRRRPGVFCLETPWSDSLTDRSSVRPLLEVLERSGVVTYAHRDAVTSDEFETYLRQWAQKRYARLGFAYLACHGDPGCVRVGGETYELERLADLLAGRLTGRVLYFSSCSTLDIELDRIEAFRAATDARAICGFTREVDWIEAAAFDLNVIYCVTYYSRIDAGFRYLDKHHRGECDRLGFRAAWATGSIGGT